MSKVRRELRKAIEDWFRGPVQELLAAHDFKLADQSAAPRDRLQAFRVHPNRIDVVGCSIRQRIGEDVTEFGIETGVFFRAVPHYSGGSWKGIEGLPLTHTLDCHFQFHLDVPMWLRWTLSDPASWVVRRKGWRFELCLAALYDKIERVGLPWFHRFADLSAVYAVLRKEPRGNVLPRGWGLVYGERIIRAFLALERHDWPTAVEALSAALALKNPLHIADHNEPPRHYHRIEGQLEAALARARGHIEE